MVVGTATASFLGGESVAINVTRFNPWCYNILITLYYVCNLGCQFVYLGTCSKSGDPNLLQSSGFMALLLRQWIWHDQECRQSSKLKIDLSGEFQIAEELRAHRVFSFLPNSGGMLKILAGHGTHPQYVEMAEAAR